MNFKTVKLYLKDLEAKKLLVGIEINILKRNDREATYSMIKNCSREVM